MKKALIITVLGPDRVGLVEQIAEALNAQGGNWTDSRMAHLSGQFAGILRMEVDTIKVDDLKASLGKLETDGLQIQVRQADTTDSNPASKHLNIEVLGQDRPGIIRDITEQLSKLNVNIEELDSEVRDASMSGEHLFAATLLLSVPEGVSSKSVQDALEEMADQLMVDLNFES